MAVLKMKPTSAGRRFQTVSDFAEITRSTPEKSLTEGLTKKSGRNNNGRVTSRRRGGGHKRLYRIIDFKRDKMGISARVAEIEYDPNRTARIALLSYADGEKRYILAPVGIQQGDVIESGDKADIKPGNALSLGRIPVGTNVSRCIPAAAARCAVPPAPMPSSWARTASTSSCACLPAKCARCSPPASPRWVRSAMCSMKTSALARPAATVG